MPFSSRRRQHEPASNSTDESSPKFTPSPRSSQSFDDQLSMIHEPNSFELRTITPHDEPAHKEELGEEDEGFLPSIRRASLDSVQSYELYTPDEDRRVLKKLDRRLVAFMALLYMLSFLDRSSEYFLHLEGSEGYRIVPPHIYISLCILSWGVVASLQAVATSFSFLLVLRALLGISEAAFGPGVPFYLSFFFRRSELAFRTGLFISASPLSASFAGALAYLITKVGEHGPLSPWRLLFLLEGFPSVLIAVWAWDFVPDGPGSAKWLSPRQREIAVMRLRSEKENEDQDEEKYQSGRRGRVNFHEVLQTLKDPKSYLTALMFFSCNVAFSSMPVFLPTVIRDMGWESITAQGLSAPPYLFAFVVVLTTAYYSDRMQSRSTFIMLHSLLATLGYGTIAISGYLQSDKTMVRYIALYPAAAGFFSAITIIITWTLNNQESDSKKGTGMALLNIIGQMGPLVGTSIFPDEDGPYYVKGMSICAGFMLFVGFLAAILRWALVRENRRLNNGRSAEYAGVPLDEGGSMRRERKKFMFML
ncbi:unnamed protein product [Alternaria alternata]